MAKEDVVLFLLRLNWNITDARTNDLNDHVWPLVQKQTANAVVVCKIKCGTKEEEEEFYIYDFIIAAFFFHWIFSSFRSFIVRQRQFMCDINPQ